MTKPTNEPVSRKPPDSEMPSSEFGELRAHLARLGVPQSEINEAIGTGAQGRTRAEIANDLLAWLKFQ